MKRHLNRRGKILVLSLSLIILISGIFVIKGLNKNEEVHILESTDNYDLKIDYPNVKNKKIKKKIDEYVKEQKDNFLNNVKEIEDLEQPKYDFNLSVNVNDYKNITHVYMLTFAYTGGAHYTRDDTSLYFDNKTKEFVDLKYFFKDEEAFKKLSSIAYYYVLKLEDKTFDELWVKRGTDPTIDNYRHFNFKDEGLEILFPPYQIASWADGEIKITIPYEEINDLLKEEYRNTSKEEEVVSIIPEVRDLTKYQDKKLIAFTFDDGPSETNTNYLLDNLDKYDAKVTFFVLGSRVNSNKETIKRAYLEGNAIGSHTYNHRNLNLLSDVALMDEVKKTNEAIKEVIGTSPTLLRPPYGNLTDHGKELANMSIILWNIDPLDWKYKDKNRVANEIIEHAHDGAIVLVHDIYKSSVEGALLAMEELQKQGYAFVTINEMAQLRGIELDTTTSYFSMKKQ